MRREIKKKIQSKNKNKCVRIFKKPAGMKKKNEKENFSE